MLIRSSLVKYDFEFTENTICMCVVFSHLTIIRKKLLKGVITGKNPPPAPIHPSDVQIKLLHPVPKMS